MRTRRAETTPKSAAAKKATPTKKAAASAESPTAGATEATGDATPVKTTPKSTKSVKAAGDSTSTQSTPKAVEAAEAPVSATPADPSPESNDTEKKSVAASKTPQKKTLKGRPAKGADTKAGVEEKAEVKAMEKVESKEETVDNANEEKKQTEGEPEVNDDAKNEEGPGVDKMDDAPTEAEDESTRKDNAMEDDGNEMDTHVKPDDAEEPEEEEVDAEEGGEEEVAEEGGGEEEGAQEEEVAVQADEQDQITDMAMQRKLKKAREIFVGGLDRDVEEGDLKKAFEVVGEVVEVRLHKDSTTNRNKGFAFVVFANQEQASRAIAEMKNPVIRGKRCGTAPSEDNDTLFLGNVCNTWTKEAIKRKLKEYGVEGVESVTLVEDTQNPGLSRGFAFVEFACHNDAAIAYKRLQKPDVVFGHPERTAKVAFAEPLREPDAEVMAQVKSVFVDGMPPYWDEDRVREHFKTYGEIERIILARNMQTVKRRDFGFVNFTTHEAAVACIEGVNNTELGDGKTKMKVKARLSNPLPKTQAVKGGMRGGFRIGQMGMGFSRFGRGFARGRFPFGRAGHMSGRGSYPRARGRGGRFFSPPNNFEYAEEMYGRRPFVGRGFHAGARQGSARSFYEGRAPVRNVLHSQRHPFPLDNDFAGPFDEEDAYFYEDVRHGFKRPFSMTEPDPGYLEPGTRVRRRFDPLSGRMHYRGSTGGSYLDYYRSDYDSTGYSSRYSDHAGGGHFY